MFGVHKKLLMRNLLKYASRHRAGKQTATNVTQTESLSIGQREAMHQSPAVNTGNANRAILRGAIADVWEKRNDD